MPARCFIIKPIMRQGALFLIPLILLVFSSRAMAFEAELIPGAIRQGDPFMLMVTLDNGDSRGKAPSADFNGAALNFTGCGTGCFIAVSGVGLEAAPGDYGIAVRAGKKEKALVLGVRETSFPVLKLTLPEDKVTLSPEDLRRADEEAGMLVDMWARTTERMWDGAFVLPLANERSTGFGVVRIMNEVKNSVHRGLDIRGREGEEVRAANSGRVVLTKELFFGGNTLVMDHGQGIYTFYMHLSGFKARPGDMVAKGSVIAYVGSTGRATGPHLHFGVKVGPLSVNPVSMTGLPLPGAIGPSRASGERAEGTGSLAD